MKRGEMIIVPEWFISLTLVEFGMLIAAAGAIVWLWLLNSGKRRIRYDDQRREMARLDRICNE